MKVNDGKPFPFLPVDNPSYAHLGVCGAYLAEDACGVAWRKINTSLGQLNPKLDALGEEVRQARLAGIHDEVLETEFENMLEFYEKEWEERDRLLDLNYRGFYTVASAPTEFDLAFLDDIGYELEEFADRTGGLPIVRMPQDGETHPLDYNLAAGEIALAPGASKGHDAYARGNPEERGTAIVSCPAGGGACALSVAKDGTVTYSVAEPEVYGWGAWGRHSAWGVEVERTLEVRGSVRDEPRDRHFLDRLGARADAFGIEPATTIAQNPTLAGTATWSGSLFGVDIGQDMLPPVFGTAQLQLDLSTLRGTARFDELTVFVENEAAPFRSPTLEYTITANGNSFSDANSHVSGVFFGPAHEEMAGILDDRRPNVSLLGGFGGTR